jgi:PST family polysaccharide transporter
VTDEAGSQSQADPGSGDPELGEHPTASSSVTETSDVRERTLSGLGWTAGFRLLQQVLQVGFTAVLARLLLPADFGLFAMMAVFVGFASLFVDLGLTPALVQRPELETRHLTAAFWLNAGMGLALMLLMMAIAPALAAFYGHPELLWLTLGMAPAFFIGSLVGVQTAILQREMNFRKLTTIENAAFVASYVVAILAALAGLGVWSLVLLTIAAGVTRSGLLWGLSPWRPSLGLDRGALSDLWGFSSRLTGANAINYWAGNADNLLIGKFVGTVPLGYYGRAYSLMLLPLTTMTQVTTRVIYPALSQLQHNHERVRRVYLRALGLVALVTFPAVVGLMALAKPFVLTLYGPNWRPAVELVQIFCVASLIQTLARTTAWIFMSQGQTRTLMKMGIVLSLTAIASFVIGLPWGVVGVTVAYTCWSVVTIYPMFVLTGRVIGLRPLRVFRAVGGVLLASAGMGLLVWLLETRLEEHWSNPARLLVGVATGIVAYPILLALISPAPYEDFRALAAERVGFLRRIPVRRLRSE